MRSAGTIYRQYRQIRKLALLRAVSASRSHTHENCYYGCLNRYKDECGSTKLIKVCGLKEKDPDICTCPEECNAFARRWKDEDISSQFQKFMSDDSAKKKMFPELWAYEWVLDKSLSEAMKSPGLFSKMLVWMISVLESILKTVNGKKTFSSHGANGGKT